MVRRMARMTEPITKGGHENYKTKRPPVVKKKREFDKCKGRKK